MIEPTALNRDPEAFGDSGRPIHVVCSPKEDYLAIITAYLPDAREWMNNFRVRRST